MFKYSLQPTRAENRERERTPAKIVGRALRGLEHRGKERDKDKCARETSLRGRVGLMASVVERWGLLTALPLPFELVFVPVVAWPVAVLVVAGFTLSLPLPELPFELVLPFVLLLPSFTLPRPPFPLPVPVGKTGPPKTVLDPESEMSGRDVEPSLDVLPPLGTPVSAVDTGLTRYPYEIHSRRMSVY